MVQKTEKVKNIITTGSELSGAAAGGALGFLAGGPIGAAGAAMAGFAISKLSNYVLLDIVDRVLSRREQVRVGAAASFAIEEIRKHLESGRLPRNDDFFVQVFDSRPKAEEIFEGILLKSKNEHEEKKVKHISNIFANAVFMSDISSNEANHLLNIAERLTYNQMCLLSLFERKLLIPVIDLRESDYGDWDETIKIPNNTISTIQEIFELYNLGLVNRIDPGNKYGSALLGCGYVAPNRISLTDLGKRCYSIMGLDEISEDELIRASESIME